jgi:deoxyadenosine/deoxycytidine kinase
MSKLTIALAIEGTIGCGKTTLLRELKQINIKQNLNILEEPLDCFCRYKQFNPLQLAYNTPKKHSAMTQLHIMQEMYRYFRASITDKHKFYITERSLTSAMPFIQALYRVNYITEFEKEKLCDIAKINADGVVVDKYFFMECSQGNSMQNIKNRRRTEEGSVSSEYIFALHEAYTQYMQEMLAEKGPAKVQMLPHDSPDLLQQLISFIFSE